MEHWPFRWRTPGGEEALAWRAAGPERRKAVLYLPGFSDYYFQHHLAEEVLEAGWEFYALEPHRWGRAQTPGVPPYHCLDLREFVPDVEWAAGLARSHSDTLVLLGHSTGGLLALLAAQEGVKVEGLFLNSPFLEFNLPKPGRALAHSLLPLAASVSPKTAIRAGLSRHYGDSIQSTLKGEWSFDLAIKPVPAHPTTLGFLASVSRAQRSLEPPKIPALMACSAASWHGREWSEEVHHADAVLGVEDMMARAAALGIEAVSIEGARHDIFLSLPEPRQRAFSILRDWLHRLSA